MRIGELAAAAEVNIQTLRYYERRGLLSSPQRLASGYRVYDADAIRRVRFIRRAQELGFTLQDIDDLLGLWTDSAVTCGAVEERARLALDRIDRKIEDLKHMRRGLSQYATACHNRSTLGDCPLLDALGGADEEMT